MFSLNISGFDKLTEALAKYQETVTEGVKDALAKSANQMADTAKANTSAEIGDAISTEISDDGLSATISANSPDAAKTEYGTQEATTKPFLNPAFEENKQVLLDSIAQTLQQQ